MNTDFNTALTLLAVGMITVFTILVLVVLFGKLLIRLVNKYFPEEIQKVVETTRQKVSTFNPNKMAAIIATVDIITRGKGKVSDIDKLD